LINFYLTYNKKYLPLKTICYNSLKRNKKINIICEQIITKSKDNGFGSDAWYEAIKLQVLGTRNLLYKSIKKNNLLCVSDVDVMYFNTTNLVADCYKFQKLDYDIFACGERFLSFYKNKINKRINSGYLIVKNNLKTRKMFNYISKIDLKQYKFADQDAINDYINKNDIKCKYLDPQKYICNCHLSKIKSSKLKKCVMFHATCAYNLEEKLMAIEKFKKMRRFFTNYL